MDNHEGGRWYFIIGVAGGLLLYEVEEAKLSLGRNPFRSADPEKWLVFHGRVPLDTPARVCFAATTREEMDEKLKELIREDEHLDRRQILAIVDYTRTAIQPLSSPQEVKGFLRGYYFLQSKGGWPTLLDCEDVPSRADGSLGRQNIEELYQELRERHPLVLFRRGQSGGFHLRKHRSLY